LDSLTKRIHQIVDAKIRMLLNKPIVNYTSGGGYTSSADALDETAHDALDHTGLTGVPSIAGLLDETAHDALDHTGLTGVATDFTDLGDVPSVYTGEGGKIVAVKSDVSGLEFVAAPAAANGLPAGGTAGQILTKDTATDYDASWQDPSGGGGGAGGSLFLYNYAWGGF
jgi:hypothetical protein